MNLNVYVAAPYEDGAFVFQGVHERLRALGMTPTSTWAEHAIGREDFSRYTPARLREFAVRNDADLRAADVALVLARAGAGGEMFAEARVAIDWGKPVVWCGRLILSAWRSGVVRAEDLDAALSILVAMQAKHAEGYRGHLLAHLVGSTA